MKAVSGMLLGLLVAVALTLVPFRPAGAHATLVKSLPANGATLKQAPPVIQATFSEELAKASVLRLYDAHQKLLASGGLDRKVSAHTALKIVPPRLGPGAYVVQWVAISADDGNTHKGSFRFSVAGAALTPGGATTAGLPPLHLVAPAGGAKLKNPVVVVIETPGDISKMTMSKGMTSMSGMGHGMGPRVHLHVAVDGQMFMPVTEDLKSVGPSRYEYRLPKTLTAGTHTVKVFWADDSTHAAAGAVQTVTFSVAG